MVACKGILLVKNFVQTIFFYRTKPSNFVIARAFLFSLAPPARAGVPEAISFAYGIASPPKYKSGGSQHLRRTPVQV